MSPDVDRDLQVKVVRQMGGANDFVAYIDAIGELDGKRCLLEWKTSSARYPDEIDGMLALDPQLVCYSWLTGIADVAQVVFVRKSLVGSTVPAHHHNGRTACGVRPPGRRHDPSH